MAMEISQADFAVADAAELPLELSHFEAAAEADKDFDASVEEWLEWLFERDVAFGCPVVFLALEQSAHDGMLLPWGMRGVRLAEAHAEVIDTLHFFWSHCPKHVAAHLTNYVYWLVRSERGRRRGTPHWSTRSPLPPEQPEPTWFQTRRLTIRRGLR